ncbi:3-dehydroquinate synthase [Kordiimonas sp. SCSIO 12610]|uniref:3-dehydroquinate synthase n=1 Tax=Kordiimonas sp. SCSIO 12610 TaxID=2829597 RepID=UPI00210F1227|nr:3-dehydroquinate synthase [Kordiimonas sp. SCSIO 12610]
MMADIMETIHLPLGERSYDIVIGAGLVGTLYDLTKDVLKRPRAVIITDENVAALHLNTAVEALKNNDIKVDTITVPAGEGSKSFANFEKVINRLLELEVERKDVVIALGGGVVGDLTGFAAATLRRGIEFIQVPTSLLAQVDSSVGGKTGINTKFGKNLLGAFHQPKKVIIDLEMLDTLPARELRAGYAEVIKYGLIDDLEFFEWLEKKGHLMVSNDADREIQAYAIGHSCRSKARIVAEDEREGGKRALLNLGHTFGHALEAECAYDGTLLHGEAVAIGMVMALDLACKLGLADTREQSRLINHLRSVDMYATGSELTKTFTVDALMKHMAQDKKVEDGKMVFITGAMGKAEVRRDIDASIIRKVLQNSLEAVV